MNRAEIILRHESEESFHDHWATTLNVDELLVHETFEAATAVENQYALNQLGDLKGKRLLDLGCGAGEAAVYFALKGADVTACEISSKLVEVVKKLAGRFNVNVNILKMEAEQLTFPDESFDLVYGNGVLHHVCLEPALTEVHRILKRGGTAVFIEPLAYNPAIKVYRRLAKLVRTPMEAPLTFKDIDAMKNLFSEVRHREFGLLTLFIFIHYYFIQRLDPSKERYWKRLISKSENHKTLFNFLKKGDELLLNIAPFLRRYCWNTVIILKK
jgi:SAM-dependent methyltransferase